MRYANVSPASGNEASTPAAAVMVVTLSLMETPGCRGIVVEQVALLVITNGEGCGEVDVALDVSCKTPESISACTKEGYGSNYYCSGPEHLQWGAMIVV